MPPYSWMQHPQLHHGCCDVIDCVSNVYSQFTWCCTSFPSCILVCQHIIYVHRLLYVLSYFYTFMGNGLCNILLRNSRMWMSDYECMSVRMHVCVCVPVSPNSSYLKWLHKAFWCVCVILEKINFWMIESVITFWET